MGGNVPHEKDESVWPLHTAGTEKRDEEKWPIRGNNTHTHTHGILRERTWLRCPFRRIFFGQVSFPFSQLVNRKKKNKKKYEKGKKKNITISSSRKVWYSSTTRSSSLWNKTWRGVKGVYTQPAKGVHYYYIGFFFFSHLAVSISVRKSVFDCPFYLGFLPRRKGGEKWADDRFYLLSFFFPWPQLDSTPLTIWVELFFLDSAGLFCNTICSI